MRKFKAVNVLKSEPLNSLTCLDSLAMKFQMTVFLWMSELGLYQACNTAIWPFTTSMSLLGISTRCESPGAVTTAGEKKDNTNTVTLTPEFMAT